MPVRMRGGKGEKPPVRTHNSREKKDSLGANARLKPKKLAVSADEYDHMVDLVREINEIPLGKKESTLCLLTKKFYMMLQRSMGHTIDLNISADLLSVAKRRIYDITNVLEGVGVIGKISKNRVQLLVQGDFDGFNNSTGPPIEESAAATAALAAKAAEIHEEIMQTHRVKLIEAEEDEAQLDMYIKTLTKSIHAKFRDPEFTRHFYVKSIDLTKIFPQSTLLSIKSPEDASMEVLHPTPTQKWYQMFLRSHSGSISVYIVNNHPTSEGDADAAPAGRTTLVRRSSNNLQLSGSNETIADSQNETSIHQQQNRFRNMDLIPSISSLYKAAANPAQSNDHHHRNDSFRKQPATTKSPFQEASNDLLAEDFEIETPPGTSIYTPSGQLNIDLLIRNAKSVSDPLEFIVNSPIHDQFDLACFNMNYIASNNNMAGSLSNTTAMHKNPAASHLANPANPVSGGLSCVTTSSSEPSFLNLHSPSTSAEVSPTEPGNAYMNLGLPFGLDETVALFKLDPPIIDTDFILDMKSSEGICDFYDFEYPGF